VKHAHSSIAIQSIKTWQWSNSTGHICGYNYIKGAAKSLKFPSFFHVAIEFFRDVSTVVQWLWQWVPCALDRLIIWFQHIGALKVKLSLLSGQKLKQTTNDKRFLCRLYTYVGNWNACPLTLSMWLSLLFGGSSGCRQWLVNCILQNRSSTAEFRIAGLYG